MPERTRNTGKKVLSRRSTLAGGGAALAVMAGAAPFGGARIRAQPAAIPDLSQASLAALGAEKGLVVGASFAVHELDRSYGPQYAAAYLRETGALTSELSFKLSTIRHDADTIDYASADRLAAFASQNGFKLRAHTLIWNDALPAWVHRLAPSEIELLFHAHLSMTIDRFRGRVWAWDVVNEPIAPWDRQPGNLRHGPFLAALGETYIARAFRTARGLDPTGLLVLNEALTETADETGQAYRDSLLALLKRLKEENVPIDAVGLQAHLRSDRRYDMGPFVGFLDEIAALGLAVHITECDVDDRAISGSIEERDRAVARIYSDFLTPVLAHKAVMVLTFWQLADHTSWLYYGALEQGRTPLPRPLLLDSSFARKPAWHAVAAAITAMPPR